MNAATITRQSKSNLALAFISLGRERKRDMTIFYAFCRVIDDIADSSELGVVPSPTPRFEFPTITIPKPSIEIPFLHGRSPKPSAAP